MKEKVIVVLGGGSARGLAHIGVLEVIEKMFDIKAIIGTSMGSIIGGLYAYGLTPLQILNIAESIKLTDYLSFFRLDFKGGFVNSKRVLHFLSEKVNNKNIEELSINYAAVAFDIKDKKTVIINRGNLASAMLASSSLPLIFKSFKYKNHLLCDGGVEYPLPLDFAHIFKKDYKIIAVNVLPPISHEPQLLNLQTDKFNECKRNNIMLSLQVTIYNQAFLAIRSLLDFKPDFYISAYSSELTSWDFIKAEQFYQIGKKSAKHFIEMENDRLPFEELKGRFDDFKRKIKSLKFV